MRKVLSHTSARCLEPDKAHISLAPQMDVTGTAVLSGSMGASQPLVLGKNDKVGRATNAYSSKHDHVVFELEVSFIAFLAK